jgi:hypothetical protein
MIRIITFAAAVVATLVLNSCGSCCTSDSKAPPLRPLPNFRSLPAEEQQVEYAK